MKGQITINIAPCQSAEYGDGVEINVAVSLNNKNRDIVVGPVLNALCNSFRLSPLRRSLILSEVASGKYDQPDVCAVPLEQSAKGDRPREY